MWYIFPQAQGLANSETARFYAINDLEEAQAFLHLYWKSIMMGRRMGGHWNSLPKSAINFIALFSS